MATTHIIHMDGKVRVVREVKEARKRNIAF
jgi:hypothetical protein